MQEEDVHCRSMRVAPVDPGRVLPSVLGALDPHRLRERGEELPRRRELGRGGRGHRDPPHRLRIRARQARDHPRVRGEPDHVARRQRPVELGDREVLVDDPAVLEEDHAHELVPLHPEQQDDGAHPVRELLREPAKHVRVPVADVVVDRDPAVPRRRDHRPARVAGKPWHELTNRILDGVHVVGLDVDRAEGRRLLPPEPRLEIRDAPGHDHHLVRETPALVQRARDRVGSDDLEVELLDALLAERGQHLAHELGRDSAPALTLPDEEVAQRAEAGRAAPGEREADRSAVVVEGEEHDPVGQDLADLGELLLEVVRTLVRRRRHLVVELPPELRDRVVVVGRRAANVHPSILAPASRYCADRFWKGTKRSPIARTSGMVRERSSA